MNILQCIMLCLGRPSQDQIADFIIQEKDKSVSYELERGTLSYRTKEEFVKDSRFSQFAIDHHRIKLGSGEETYRRAIDSLKSWKQFAVEWVELCYPETPIAVGSAFVILANVLGTYSLSACKVVYVIKEDDPNAEFRRFGFGSGTLPMHVAQGEERFLIEWDTKTNDVYYDVLAFSKPGSWWTKMAYPIARYIQDSFGKESIRAMYDSVNGIIGDIKEITFV